MKCLITSAKVIGSQEGCVKIYETIKNKNKETILTIILATTCTGLFLKLYMVSINKWQYIYIICWHLWFAYI